MDVFKTLILDTPALEGAGGDVVGPASATDNAVVRFDSTTGKLIQNSGVSISDANLLTTTALTVNDNTTLGSSNTDTVNFNARVASDINPSTDNTYDLGVTGHEWRNLNIDGTANIDSLVADTADINGGTIDGTTIGAGTPSTGAFTTLSASGQFTNTTLSSALFRNGANTLVIGADSSASTLTDSTNKIARIGVPHYLNAELPMCAMLATSQAIANAIIIGGGTANLNAATLIDFHTAATNTTPTGTRRGGFNSSGRFDLTANIASTSSTTGTLVVTGGVGVAGTVNATDFRGTIGATTPSTGAFTTLGVGNPPLTNVKLVTIGAGLTGTSQFNLASTVTATSEATVAYLGYSSNISTEASAFTMTDMIHFRAGQGTIGIGSTVTNQTGYLVLNSMTGATNNYGFRGLITAAANRYNLYMDGSAQNYLAGNLGIGSGKSAPAYPVDVTGTVNATDFRGTVGATTPSTGAFTTLAASVGDATNVLLLSRTGVSGASVQLNFGSARPNIVYSDGAILTISDLATDAAEKEVRLGLGHYTNSEQPLALIYGSSTSAASLVAIGGGSSALNAATEVGIYAAANNTTTTGTKIGSFTSTGLAVTGALSSTGALAIGNTVAAAVAVASTHKVTIVIGGVTYYLLATNV